MFIKLTGKTTEGSIWLNPFQIQLVSEADDGGSRIDVFGATIFVRESAAKVMEMAEDVCVM